MTNKIEITKTQAEQRQNSFAEALCEYISLESSMRLISKGYIAVPMPIPGGELFAVSWGRYKKHQLLLGFCPLLQLVTAEQRKALEDLESNTVSVKPGVDPKCLAVVLAEIDGILGIKRFVQGAQESLTLWEIIRVALAKKIADDGASVNDLKIAIVSMQDRSEFFDENNNYYKVGSLNLVTSQIEIDDFVGQITPYLQKFGLIKQKSALSVELIEILPYNCDVCKDEISHAIDSKKCVDETSKVIEAYEKNDTVFLSCYSRVKHSISRPVEQLVIELVFKMITEFGQDNLSIVAPDEVGEKDFDQEKGEEVESLSPEGRETTEPEAESEHEHDGELELEESSSDETGEQELSEPESMAEESAEMGEQGPESEAEAVSELMEEHERHHGHEHHLLEEESAEEISELAAEMAVEAFESQEEEREASSEGNEDSGEEVEDEEQAHEHRQPRDEESMTESLERNLRQHEEREKAHFEPTEPEREKEPAHETHDSHHAHVVHEEHEISESSVSTEASNLANLARKLWANRAQFKYMFMDESAYKTTTGYKHLSRPQQNEVDELYETYSTEFQSIASLKACFDKHIHDDNVDGFLEDVAKLGREQKLELLTRLNTFVGDPEVSTTSAELLSSSSAENLQPENTSPQQAITMPDMLEEDDH